MLSLTADVSGPGAPWERCAALPSIFHVDLDAFYASVEQTHKPSLRGKPVIVGGVGVRGVVSTASSEARAFGVHSALATGIARRRAPNAAYLIPRFGAYQAYSEVVMALMHDLSPLVEPLSLDEAFVDVSHLFEPADTATPRRTRRAREIAGGLRDRIKAATGLTASVGAAPSKLVAKIASDAEKPDGLVVVEPGSEQALAGPAAGAGAVGRRPGHRRAAAQDRRPPPSSSCGPCPARSWSSSWRRYGGSLYAIARGLDDRDVSPDRELKSVSVEDTFAEDLLDPASIAAEMDRLVTRLSSRLRRAGRSGRTINIKVRGHDFTTVSRSETTVGPTDDPAVIRAATHRMLPGAVAAATQSVPGIRLLGVGLSGLAEWAQLDLFAVDDELDTALDLWDQAAEPPAAVVDDDFDMPRGVLTRPQPETSWTRTPRSRRRPTRSSRRRATRPTRPTSPTPVDTVEGERSPRQFGPLPPGTRRAVETAAGRAPLPGRARTSPTTSSAAAGSRAAAWDG